MARQLVVLLSILMLCSNRTAFAAPPFINSSFFQNVLEVPDDVLENAKLLGSKDFMDRENAHEALMKQGERIVHHLRKILPNTTDVETKRRIAVIVNDLEWDRVRNPRKVSLNVKQITPVEALRKIVEQAGYRISQINQDNEKRLFDFNFDQVPFWEAADKIGNDSGYHLASDGLGGFSVQFSDAMNPYVAYSGPFRILASQISSGKNLQLSNLGRGQFNAVAYENLNFNMMISTEPKTSIIKLRTCTPTKITDEKNNNLMAQPQESQSNYYSYQGEQRAYDQHTAFNFTRPNTELKTLKTIEGKINVDVLLAIKPELILTDLTKLKGKKFYTKTLKVEMTEAYDPKKTPNQVTLQFTLIQNNRNNNRIWEQINSMNQKIIGFDAEGQQYETQINNQNYINDSTFAITLLFNLPDNNNNKNNPVVLSKIHINEWITRNLDINFKFKDVPLP